MSILVSFIAAIASGWTRVALVPARCTTKRSPASARRKPSAIWERAELCEHMNSTRFIT